MRFLINKENISQEEAEALLLQPRDKIGVDVETVSLDNKISLGVAVAISKDVGFYFFNPNDEFLHKVIEGTPTIIIQNAKYDLPILKRLGYFMQGYEDTKLLAYAAGYLQNDLETLSSTVLLRECPSVTSQWKKKDSGNIGIDHVKMGSMSIIHACNAYALWDKIPKTPLYYDIDKPCIELIMEMERWGLLIDQYKLTEVEQATVVKTNQMELELKNELGDINLNSNPQLAKALKTKGIIGTRKTGAGKEAVSEESLRPLDHPITNKLLAYRSEMKTLTTYVPPFRNPDIEGRIHTRFGNTNTGRWNSSHPNLQNITQNDLRKCIVSGEGYSFLSLDASQIELRVLAMISQDPLLLEAVASEDLHMATALQIFGYTNDKEVMNKRRYDAKQGNFAVVYGAEEYKIAEMLKITVPEAQEFLAAYFGKYNVLDRWIKDVKIKAKQDGYVVNLFGRVRAIPELTSGSWRLREKGEREAVNTIIQGTAVDIVKKMMLYLRGLLSPENKLVLQVHDEILWEVPNHLLENTIEICKDLSLAFPDYPCKICIGKSYGELEKIE